MFYKKFVFILLFIFFTIVNFPTKAFAAEQPTAIFHAFNQNYSEVEKFVCTLADQGYSPRSNFSCAEIQSRQRMVEALPTT